jgi:hypothetical protein
MTVGASGAPFRNETDPVLGEPNPKGFPISNGNNCTDTGYVGFTDVDGKTVVAPRRWCSANDGCSITVARKNDQGVWTNDLKATCIPANGDQVAYFDLDGTGCSYEDGNTAPHMIVGPGNPIERDGSTGYDGGDNPSWNNFSCVYEGNLCQPPASVQCHDAYGNPSSDHSRCCGKGICGKAGCECTDGFQGAYCSVAPQTKFQYVAAVDAARNCENYSGCVTNDCQRDPCTTYGRQVFGLCSGASCDPLLSRCKASPPNQCSQDKGVDNGGDNADCCTRSVCMEEFPGSPPEVGFHCNACGHEGQHICDSGGGGGCFPSNSIVETPDGPLRVCKLAVGDRIRVAANNYEPVLGFFDHSASARNPCCRIHIKDGRTLRTTPDHLVHVEGRGFVRARRVRAGDLVLTVDGARSVVCVECTTDEWGVYSPAVSGGGGASS